MCVHAGSSDADGDSVMILSLFSALNPNALVLSHAQIHTKRKVFAYKVRHTKANE